MTTHLYLAPAAAGKTEYAIDRASEIAQGLQDMPRVCLATHLQVRSWRRRLAKRGGAIGVRLFTFDGLYAECLNAAGQVCTVVDEPVQYRLIRSVLDDLSPAYYAPLVTRPGFIRALQEMIAELKAAYLQPSEFSRAVDQMGAEPRLSELALVYSTYQERLQGQSWTDRAGLGWLAIEALDGTGYHVARDWPVLIVDGFDNFTPVQIELIKLLSVRAEEVVITLTGTTGGGVRELAHRRFNETRRQVEEALGIAAECLPEETSHHHPALAHLEQNLFRRERGAPEKTTAVQLVESTDRAGEVRSALRWLKERLVLDHFELGDVALLARSISPYRPFILQTAEEFGLPISLVDGRPLRTSPAVAAIVDLLRLVSPSIDDASQLALPRRLLIEAWRSPYFDWAALTDPGEQPDPIGIGPADADLLDNVSRWGQVIGGLAQWEQALDRLANVSAEARTGDEERDLPDMLPVGDEARALKEKFARFVRRLTPPPTARCYRDWVVWLEGIVGPDPTIGPLRGPVSQMQTSLSIVARACEAEGEIAEWDVAALRALKDVLRGLVRAEETFQPEEPVQYPQFFRELLSAIEATTYRIPAGPDDGAILVADVIQARGIPFEAVAVLGLAEGEFPTSLSEDTFIRDADRQRLREEFGLPLRPSAESAEAGYFYEAVTRPRERLLLTRPRLAEGGALWQASSYWEEVGDCLEVELERADAVPRPAVAASWPELLESLGTYPGHEPLHRWAAQVDAARCTALQRAANILQLRRTGAGDSPFNGALTHLQSELAARFGPDHTWSASRLESYRRCPFLFFAGSVLRLEQRIEPAEGLDARQLGNIYHHILEKLYQSPEVTEPSDLDQLLAALAGVAQTVLDEAPEREGFRATAWWKQTRAEITENVQRSLVALDELAGDFIPYGQEIRFWEPDALVFTDREKRFRLHGLIDRVDRDSRGRLRIIDYKIAHPSGYDNRAISDGRKLQLPLYALAARDALDLGDPVDGFYWHVRHAQPSSFSLSEFPGGVEAALETATRHAWEAVSGIREGGFVPDPPDDGCPSHCPAAAFCWQYRSRLGD